MAIDKERRRSGHATAAASGHVGPDVLEIPVRLQRLAETCLIESQPARIVDQIPVFKFPLAGKQQGIHRPKLSLCGGGFRRLRRLYGMRMLLRERKMSKHKSKVIAEFTLQGLNCLDRLTGVGAFESPYSTNVTRALAAPCT